MFSHSRHAARLAMLAILVASIIAPNALAGRYGPAGPPSAAVAQRSSPPTATCHQYCGTVAAHRTQGTARPVLVQRELVPTSAGFEWGDAAIGFAVACGCMLLGLLTFQAARRTHLRPADDPS